MDDVTNGEDLQISGLFASHTKVAEMSDDTKSSLKRKRSSKNSNFVHVVK